MGTVAGTKEEVTLPISTWLSKNESGGGDGGGARLPGRRSVLAEKNDDHSSSSRRWECVSPTVAIRILCALADLDHRDRDAAHWLAGRAFQVRHKARGKAPCSNET